MLFKNIPIRQKLTTLNLLTSGAVLLLTCVAFFVYEYHTFRQSTIRQLSTLGEIIAANSTAALAFDSPKDAEEILAALSAEQHIVSAILFDTEGEFFGQYPSDNPIDNIPENPGATGFKFTDSHLEGFQPVLQGDEQLGMLYLKSDLKAMDERFRLYGYIVGAVIVISLLLALFLSSFLQESISRPILDLAKTARLVSEQQDYSVRAEKNGNDEIGALTEAFNQMLGQIQDQNIALSEFNKNLELKVVERTKELEIANQEQKEAEKEIFEKNKALSKALEELQIAEEHLRKLNNDLEKRVLERTNELKASENTLIAKNKELEKINVDLDNFIYTASHDLKSPIVNLEGLINHLRKKLQGIDSFEDFNLLDMLKTSIEKLKNTIADLTEITKVQKDLEEDAQQVSFKEILEDVKDGINANIIESKAIINESLEVIQIVYPRKNLRSIIYNLLSNAIKYRAVERPLEIDIKTYKENGSIVLLVEDNGMGVSKNQQHKLFAMFKRLHTHVEGTGIGLYIIKRIIENRGGWIEVESTLNEGTVFKVYFKNLHEEVSSPVPFTK